MYSFDAHYDEEGAARAERTFFVRSVRELRPWSTFAPPVFFSVVVAVGSAVGAPGWFLLSFGGFLVASVLLPLFFYFATPAAAAQLARKHPVRNISISEEALKVRTGEHNAIVPWSRVRHVWAAPGYTLLVLGKFTCISIPVASLPAGAHELIHRAARLRATS
jgi:hypothetical protein